MSFLSHFKKYFTIRHLKHSHSHTKFVVFHFQEAIFLGKSNSLSVHSESLSLSNQSHHLSEGLSIQL